MRVKECWRWAGCRDEGATAGKVSLPTKGSGGFFASKYVILSLTNPFWARQRADYAGTLRLGKAVACAPGCMQDHVYFIAR
jgi:hypothetical protein